MMGGDISNYSPALVMVHVDVIAPRKVEEVRRLGGLIRSTKKQPRRVNLRTANALYRNSQTFRGVSLECFDFDVEDPDDFLSVERFLDRKGINPFRYFERYDSIQEVIRQSAYLPNLMGIVDVPERGLRYGSKFMPSLRLLGNNIGG